MTTKRGILLGGLATVVALAAALWWFVLRNDAPPPPELGGIATTQPTADAGTGAATSPTDLVGPWSVVAADSFVGYRVQEELARFGFTEAVGRTSQIEGFLEISGSVITAVNITVDMASLRSDSERRDGALRRQALETDEFPTASFVLAEPIELGSIPAPQTPFSTTAVDFVPPKPPTTAGWRASSPGPGPTSPVSFSIVNREPSGADRWPWWARSNVGPTPPAPRSGSVTC